MKFNSGEDSIVNNTLDELSLTIEQYPLTKLARSTNRGIDKMAHIVMGSDDDAQWDDTNHGDEPIATVNITSGQRAYQILEDGNQVEILKLLAVTIEDENGNVNDLDILDIRDDGSIGLRRRDSDPGTPYVADWMGDSLFLDPVPDYTRANAMRLFFQRSPQHVVSTDTTFEPGFAKMYHEYFVLYNCERWCRSKDQQKYLNYRTQRQEMEREISDYFGAKNVTDNKQLIAGDEDPF